MTTVIKNWMPALNDSGGAGGFIAQFDNPLQFGSTETAALIMGSGTSTTPTATASAKNFLGFYLKSTATSGDVRGIYTRVNFEGAGAGGEAVRAYANVGVANAAPAGTINGIHASLAIAASSNIGGQGAAGRFTIDAATATRSLEANISSLILDSNIGANNTVHANTAFIRVVNVGSVAIKKLFNLPTVASAGLLAAHTTDAMTHSVRCVDAAGTVFYLMATTTASNRTGGA